MHEMSLAEGIRDIVETSARNAGAERIKTVRVEIGKFAGVEKEALAFCFDVVMKGSVGDGAELVMIDLPATAVCFGCGETVEIEDRLDPCPKCGSARLQPASGDEMRVKDLEAA